VYDFSTMRSDVTTLAGSVRLVSDLLLTMFPDATLLFVTPLQMSKTDAETVFKVSDIIERAAAEKGGFTLRADKKSGIRHEEEVSEPKYTSDGVHTNPEGARMLGKFILDFLISHLNSKTDKLSTDN
ncbi:MAG: SGNH/GDSL hydrolase family protein, partial [Muribaculaceae bacterium]|nr:SGNH/GDSL hydrolase family protein [Muribaculaceae bacterium]